MYIMGGHIRLDYVIYYQGQAEYILQNIDTTEHYFHFVNTILKDYNKLNVEQKRQSKIKWVFYQLSKKKL